MISINKNIIIVVYTPFSKRDYKRYGIEVLKNNNYNVLIIDLSPIIAKEVFNSINIPDPYKSEFYITIFNKSELESILKNFGSNCIVYSTLVFELKTLFFYKLITKYNVPYCVTGLSSLPNFNISKSIIKFPKINNNLINLLLNQILIKIPFYILRINSAEMVTLISEKANFKRPEVSINTKIVYTHSSDYDDYLETTSSDILTEQYNIVFLDNFLPYHPDSLHTGEKSPVTPDLYHKKLNDFFNYIEEFTNLKVIIAAHPKSTYSSSFNPFDNRSIIRGHTSSLVRNSKFVILNFSTSLNFAILFQKPLLFFTTNELNNIPFYKNQINGIASLFKKDVINIDYPVKLTKENINLINYESYENYKNNYIKKNNTEQIHSWQIKINNFNNILQKTHD